MHRRMPLVLSATALAVALLGSTPLGEAARDAIPPLAKRAKTADYAKNAGAVGKIKASRKPRAGFLVPLAKNGRFPASVAPRGQLGAQGPKGDTGPRGPQGAKGDTGTQGLQGSPGVSAYTVVKVSALLPAQGSANATAQCPPRTSVLGGGVSAGVGDVELTFPVNANTAWRAVVRNPTIVGTSMTVHAVCARVSS